MALTLKDKVRVERFLHEFGDVRCPICKSWDWSISDRVFALSEYDPPNQLALLSQMALTPDPVGPNNPFYLSDLPKRPPQVFPVLPLTCVICGYVFLVSAKKLGIV